MPSDLVSRINLDLLYPRFLEMYLETLARCRKKGHTYHATSGYRSPEDQKSLWNKGRNGTGQVVSPSKVVTRTRFSAHCAGVAVDSVLDTDDRPGIQPGWDLKHYKTLGEEAEKLGLEAGVFWKGFPDGPHVQLPLRKHGISLSSLDGIYTKEGLSAVWAHLDAKGPW